MADVDDTIWIQDVTCDAANSSGKSPNKPPRVNPGTTKKSEADAEIPNQTEPGASCHWHSIEKVGGCRHHHENG